MFLLVLFRIFKIDFINVFLIFVFDFFIFIDIEVGIKLDIIGLDW